MRFKSSWSIGLRRAWATKAMGLATGTSTTVPCRLAGSHARPKSWSASIPSASSPWTPATATTRGRGRAPERTWTGTVTQAPLARGATAKSSRWRDRGGKRSQSGHSPMRRGAADAVASGGIALEHPPTHGLLGRVDELLPLDRRG